MTVAHVLVFLPLSVWKTFPWLLLVAGERTACSARSEADGVVHCSGTACTGDSDLHACAPAPELQGSLHLVSAPSPPSPGPYWAPPCPHPGAPLPAVARGPRGSARPGWLGSVYLCITPSVVEPSLMCRACRLARPRAFLIFRLSSSDPGPGLWVPQW